MSELDKMLLPLAATLAVGFGTWICTTLLKLKEELEAHKNIFGHKPLLDALNELEKDLLARLADLDKRIDLNSSSIFHNESSIKDLSRAVKYRFRSHDERIALIAEILKKEGHEVLNHLRLQNGDQSKDTFSSLDRDED